MSGSENVPLYHPLSKVKHAGCVATMQLTLLLCLGSVGSEDGASHSMSSPILIRIAYKRDFEHDMFQKSARENYVSSAAGKHESVFNHTHICIYKLLQDNSQIWI